VIVLRWSSLVLIVPAFALGPWSFPTDGRLAPSPFALSMSSFTPRYGETTMVRIDLARRPPESADHATYDLYLVQVFANQLLARQEPYLTPAGSWSATPTPIRRAVSLAEFTRTESPWVTSPAGWFPMALVVVPAGRAPAVRRNWAFKPIVCWVRVARPPDPHAPSTNRQVEVLGTLALISLAVAIVVWVMPGRIRAHRS